MSERLKTVFCFLGETAPSGHHSDRGSSSMAAVVHSYDPEEVALSGVLKKCCSMWARVPELGRGSDVEAMPVMILQ